MLKIAVKTAYVVPSRLLGHNVQTSPKIGRKFYSARKLLSAWFDRQKIVSEMPKIWFHLSTKTYEDSPQKIIMKVVMM